MVFRAPSTVATDPFASAGGSPMPRNERSRPACEGHDVGIGEHQRACGDEEKTAKDKRGGPSPVPSS